MLENYYFVTLPWYRNNTRRLSHNLFVSSPQLWDETTCNFTPKTADWSQTEITSYIKLYMETVTWMNIQRDLVRPPNSFHLWPIQIWSQFLIITILLKKTILKQFIQSIPWSMHSITFRHLLFPRPFSSLLTNIFCSISTEKIFSDKDTQGSKLCLPCVDSWQNIA